MPEPTLADLLIAAMHGLNASYDLDGLLSYGGEYMPSNRTLEIEHLLMLQHHSDCARHNRPAFCNQRCNCEGGSDIEVGQEA